MGGFVTASHRIRVKICGLTRPEDARAAIQAGADAIGLVFYPPSPRHVTLEQAEAIADLIPPFVTLTGLFVNAEASEVERVLDRVPIDLLQFHGDELPETCEVFRRPYIKALRVRPGLDLKAAHQAYQRARGLLLDTYRPGVPGGTGDTFDWSLIPKALAGQIILAGGLNPDNVAAAVQQVRPYAVDVSGGVEASKGIKDADKIKAFFQRLDQYHDIERPD
jgi:phosphoribosylanthranilate isomerase